MRFVERMRRAIAHEYGLELSSVLPGQAFVARFDGEQDQQVQPLSLSAAPSLVVYALRASASDRGPGRI